MQLITSIDEDDGIRLMLGIIMTVSFSKYAQL
jgi:hypothetical protein